MRHPMEIKNEAVDSQAGEFGPIFETIHATLAKHGLESVQCVPYGKGVRLVGQVTTAEDRVIAFALARTTAGTTVLSNGIEVKKS